MELRFLRTIETRQKLRDPNFIGRGNVITYEHETLTLQVCVDGVWLDVPVVNADEINNRN